MQRLAEIEDKIEEILKVLSELSGTKANEEDSS
jgi:hypothetical protein